MEKLHSWYCEIESGEYESHVFRLTGEDDVVQAILGHLAESYMATKQIDYSRWFKLAFRE